MILFVDSTSDGRCAGAGCEANWLRERHSRSSNQELHSVLYYLAICLYLFLIILLLLCRILMVIF